jgi:hypothetical protein
MKNNRREFFKLGGLAGAGFLGSNVIPGFASAQTEDKGKSKLDHIRVQAMRKHNQRFNMCGYAAPKMDKVRIGFIGLGNRGPVHSNQTSRLEGVEIVAMCDLRPEKAEAAKKQVMLFGHNPVIYAGKEEEWKKLCNRNDIDLIYISTPWHLHAPMAVYAMNHGKHVCIEVPAANTLEECWQLVETSERTRKHCMMVENACYLFWDLLILNMARQGFFGEIIHAEGAYIHDLLDYNFDKNNLQGMWRLKENTKRNGNLYPTHGLGPVCQVMNINRGDKFDYLVSVSGNDFMMGEKAKALAAKDDFYKPYVNKPYRGNMNTTTIRTTNGRTIMLQHDVSSPRVKTLINLISGTKGTAMEYPLPGRISTGHKGWLTEQEVKELQEKYQPPIVKRIGEMAKQIGGHGGIDFLMNWHTIDCLRNGLPLSQDVYDAASWTAIGPLSEWSVANRSNSITVPDFTGGSWKKNQPIDLSLAQGGNTKILSQKAMENIKEF